MSKKGVATIPKELRERFVIDTPGWVLIYEEDEKIVVKPLSSIEEVQGEVFVYGAQGRVVIEPVPSPDELHSIHAGEHGLGSVLERVRELKDEDRRCEVERAERIRTSEDA